jgi:GNAT superfamily N-acetyltransferase
MDRSESGNIIVIRLAMPAEHEVLEALLERASLANENDREALLAHPDEMSLPIAQIRSGQVIVADAAGTLVGFASVVFRQDGDIELDGLFVEPAEWRKGIGRMLVEACKSFTRGVGARALCVTISVEAEGFYHACGFATLGPEETLFGPGIRLEFRLQQEND